jgi:hypothetical protein
MLYNTMSILPYDMVNKILGYLEDISDSGWKMQIDSRGRIRLSLKQSFTDIHYVVAFKTTHIARYVKLRVKEWTRKFDTIEYTIDALEQPFCHSPIKRELHNYIGFLTDNRCYSYVDPKTNKQLIAYTESRKYFNHANIYYQTGYVYDFNTTPDREFTEAITKPSIGVVPNKPLYVISGYGADEPPNTVRFDISPYIFEWFIEREGNYEAADALMEMANGGQEQEQEPEHIIEHFEYPPQPLQMYM